MAVVGDLGEKRFIREVLGRYARTALPGSLDDCVVIGPRSPADPGAQCIVYSIDHPSPIDRPMPGGLRWRYFGRWAAACTCNDVLAMGARPRGFALDLTVATDTDLDVIEDFYQGLADVLGAYGAELEGGNVDVQDGLGVVCMSWGTVSQAGIIRRRGARPGDIIAVTTELGVGWASYVLRRRGLFDRLSEPARVALEEYNLMPLAPHEAIAGAARLIPGAITSGMDISDGVVEFLYTIRETGGLGAALEEERLPATPLLKECAGLLGVPPAMLAVEYGFDMPRAHGYTIDPARWEEVEELFAQYGAGLHRIGHVTAEPDIVWVSPSRGARPLAPFWDDNCRRDDSIERWYAQLGFYAG